MTTTIAEPVQRERVPYAASGEDAWGDRLGFALVFCVVNLHILRNVSTIGYLGIYGLVTAWVSWKFVRTDWRALLDDRGTVIGAWIGLGLFGLLTSLAVISPAGAAYGTVRYLFAVPVFFAFVVFTKSLVDLRWHIFTMLAFFIAASWTLPLQFITGPIPWFDEASVRGGEVRYSSLVGSLTSIGVVVGCYLVLCAIARHPWVWVLLALASLPAAVSLSKAALANVVLGWAICVWFNRRRPVVFLGALLGIPLIVALTSAFVPAVRLRVETVAVSFGLQTGAGSLSNDVSLVQSVRDRLTGLPGENWNALGDFGSPLAYLTGGGYGMGHTALVTESDVTAPMAHNQFVETLSVFGLVGGLVQIAILMLVMTLLVVNWWRLRHSLYAVLGVMFVIYLLNGLLANGVAYQPAAASLLFLAMFSVLSPVVRRDAAAEVRASRASLRKEPIVDITEILRAFRTHWVAALVAAVLGAAAAFGVASLMGGSTDDEGPPVASFVRVAFLPVADSSTDAYATADFIETQMGYWGQLSQVDSVLTEANDGDGSDSELGRIRDECVVELPANNVQELRCTGTDANATEAFLVRWVQAIEDVVLDRGLSESMGSGVSVSAISDPTEATAAGISAVDASSLKYPFALVVGLMCALVAVLVGHFRARRRVTQA